jgi:hypothetical protein
MVPIKVVAPGTKFWCEGENMGITTALLGDEVAGIVMLIVGILLLPVTLVIVVIANRADPDATGKRPLAAYLFGGSFFTLWLTYIGALTIVTALVSLIGKQTYYGFSPEKHPFGDAAIRDCTIGALLLIIAGVLHEVHLRRGLALAEGETSPASPTVRLIGSYVAVTSFISMLIGAIGLIVTLYTVFGLIAPGVYQASTRTDSLKGLLTGLAVVIFALIIFIRSQGLVSSDMRLLKRKPRMTTATTVTVPDAGTPSAS